MKGEYRGPSAARSNPTQSTTDTRNVNGGGAESLQQHNANVGAQPQNLKSARVYVFGDDSIEEDDNIFDQSEMPELRARGGAARRHLQQAGTSEVEDTGPTYFEKPVDETDTLLSVALKYGCKVAEIKRINNLIQDQDFYALKTVRIPVQRHGLLTELIQEHLNGDVNAHQQSNKSSQGGTIGSVSDYDAMEDDEDYDPERDTEHRALLVRNLSIRDSFGTQSREAVDFLKKMDTDIKHIVQSTNSRKDTLEEVRNTLTCKSIHPIRGTGRKLFDGVDCGMRWWSILIVMLLLLLGGPLLYFLYFEYVKPSS